MYSLSQAFSEVRKVQGSTCPDFMPMGKPAADIQVNACSGRRIPQITDSIRMVGDVIYQVVVFNNDR